MCGGISVIGVFVFTIYKNKIKYLISLAGRWCSSRVQSSLVLPCLISLLDSAFLLLSFLFPLLFLSVTFDASLFIQKRTAQESLIPTHPSIPSCIVDLSIPVLAYPHKPPISTPMDIYTSAFSYPRRPRHARNTTPPLDFPSHSQSDRYQQPQFQPPHHNGHAEPHVTPTALETEAVQKLAVLAMTTQGCHVSFSIADHGTGWNFLLSGAYQQVLFARGTILKDCPIQVGLPPV